MESRLWYTVLGFFLALLAFSLLIVGSNLDDSFKRKDPWFRPCFQVYDEGQTK